MVAWDVLEMFVAGVQLDRHSSDRGASTVRILGRLNFGS
jgi:hypothetical protein